MPVKRYALYYCIRNTNEGRRMSENNHHRTMRYREYLYFSVKDRNLFHRVDTIGNIFTSGTATSENITDGVHEMKKKIDLSQKKRFCLFHAFNPFWEKIYQNAVQFFSVIPRGVPLPHSNKLQYYVKSEKFKVFLDILPESMK